MEFGKMGRHGLIIGFYLFVKAYLKGEIFQIIRISLSDTRKLEALLNEISIPPLTCDISKNCATNFHDSHNSTAQNNIQQVINNIHDDLLDDELLRIL